MGEKKWPKKSPPKKHHNEYLALKAGDRGLKQMVDFTFLPFPRYLEYSKKGTHFGPFFDRFLKSDNLFPNSAF